MKFHLGVSVSLHSGEAIGNVCGTVELPAVPMIGDSLEFVGMSNNWLDKPILGFNGCVDVTSRAIRVNEPNAVVSVSLREIVLQGREDALILMRFLESEFGLVADIYDE